MKRVLLLLSVLVFAAPVWAADMAAASGVPQASTQAAPAAQTGKAKKTRKHRKTHKKSAKKMKTESSALKCPSGCVAETCGGVTACYQGKPAPLCGTRC